MINSFEINFKDGTTGSIGNEKLSLQYHTRFLGYIFWWLGWADWVTVNERQLYVNHISWVALVSKISDAAKILQKDHNLFPNLSEKEFYKKVMAAASQKEFPRVLSSSGITNLNQWLLKTIGQAYSERVTAPKSPSNEQLYKQSRDELTKYLSNVWGHCLSKLDDTANQIYVPHFQEAFAALGNIEKRLPLKTEQENSVMIRHFQRVTRQLLALENAATTLSGAEMVRFTEKMRESFEKLLEVNQTKNAQNEKKRDLINQLIEDGQSQMVFNIWSMAVSQTSITRDPLEKELKSVEKNINEAIKSDLETLQYNLV